jgi:LacI family transcriptional regulator
MTTIREIASAAGVSIGTVSNYLNDPELVAPETRQKIQAKIKETNYHPKAAARSLKSRQTHRVGLVRIISPEDYRSTDPGDNAFLELLSGLNIMAAEKGYDLLISAAKNNEEELKTYSRLIGSGQVDGLVVIGIQRRDERLPFLLERNIPFVAYGRSELDENYPFVDVNGADGIKKAIKYLADLGHKKIAYITPPEDLMCTQQRWQGYIQGLEESNLQLHPDYVVEGAFSQRAGQIATHLLLDLPEPPTAILTASDVCAFGSIRAIHSRGLTVGKDISVIGFDDIALADMFHPSLTTISQPFRQIGFELMQSLISVISGENSLPQTILNPQLVVRRSTGAPLS